MAKKKVQLNTTKDLLDWLRQCVGPGVSVHVDETVSLQYHRTLRRTSRETKYMVWIGCGSTASSWIVSCKTLVEAAGKFRTEIWPAFLDWKDGISRTVKGEIIPPDIIDVVAETPQPRVTVSIQTADQVTAWKKRHKETTPTLAAKIGVRPECLRKALDGTSRLNPEAYKKLIEVISTE